MKSSLKEFANSGFKLRDHILSEVSNPLLVALKECKVLIFVGLELLEIFILPACLVVFQMLDNMIIEESLQEVQLEVVLVVELLALLGLKESIGLILVAVLDGILLELLLSHSLQFEHNTVLDLELCSLNGLKCLSEILNIDVPRSSVVCQVVQRGLLLLLECCTFSHLCYLCLIIINID